MPQPSQFLMSIHNTASYYTDVVSMLTAANAVASPMQSLLLLPLIAKATEVQSQIRALLDATMAEQSTQEDMLDALRNLLGCGLANKIDHMDTGGQAAVSQARAAIAKATGGEH